ALSVPYTFLFFFSVLLSRLPFSSLFPYTTLFRSKVFSIIYSVLSDSSSALLQHLYSSRSFYFLCYKTEINSFHLLRKFSARKRPTTSAVFYTKSMIR